MLDGHYELWLLELKDHIIPFNPYTLDITSKYSQNVIINYFHVNLYLKSKF